MRRGLWPDGAPVCEPARLDVVEIEGTAARRTATNTHLECGTWKEGPLLQGEVAHDDDDGD